MLPADARLRRSADFTRVTRRGRRGATPTVVVHLEGQPQGATVRAGFIVSKKVGNSVVRHRVTRRLRALMRSRLAALPDGTDVVVRALPTAATAPFPRLADDLDTALRTALRKGRRS